MNRRRISFPLIMLALAAFGTVTSSLARVRVGTLAGVVVDANGKPVPRATVTIQTSFGDEPNATHTDSHGRFEFAHFRTGQYDLQAYSKGSFTPWLRRITIRSNHKTEVTLRMPPVPDVVVKVSH